MRSHYLEHLDRGLETRPPARAFRENEGYLNLSRYAFQLAEFTEHVAPERILVVRSEDMKTERRATLARIFAFIGVDEAWYDPLHPMTSTIARNTRSSEPLMSTRSSGARCTE